MLNELYTIFDELVETHGVYKVENNLLVRIHFSIVMIRWTGLAPWVFEFPFPGSLISSFLERRELYTIFDGLVETHGVYTVDREFFIHNLLVRIHFIIVMIRWTGLGPWESEFPFSGSLTSAFLVQGRIPLPLPSKEGKTSKVLRILT